MPKKTTKKSARERADRSMSLYIRTKYASDNGLVKCITCPAIKPISEMDCAHFVSRGKAATRFLEENCHPACRGCNRMMPEQHMRRYTLFMIDTYGRDFVDELETKSREICRHRMSDYLDIEAHYRGLLQSL